MKNTSYTTIINVNQPAETVFNSICNITKWWTKDFEGNSTHLNDEFIINHPNQHYSKQKLIEFLPSKKIVWLITESKLPWLKDDQEEWTNTIIDFEISSNNSISSLQFIHEGLTPNKECYNLCAQGWTIVINEWLYHYITTGAPSPDMDQAAEIRNKYLDSLQ